MLDSLTLRNRLKLRQLQLLATLGEARSLHQAAAQLGMTQPAATRLLREVEELLDTPLFERTSRGLHPTDMGRLLVRHATVLLSSIDQIYDDAQALKAGNGGSLKIGIFPGTWPLLLPKAIMRLKEDTPRIHIEIQDGTQDALLNLLRTGALQVVIGRAPEGDAARDLAFDIVLRETFSIVCRPEHPLLQGRTTPPSLADLIDHRWILPLRKTPLRNSLDLYLLSQCGRVPIDVIDSAAVTANLALIWEGDYFAVMPHSIARYYATRKLIVPVIDQLPHLVGPVVMITLASTSRLRQVERFAEALRAALS